MTVKTTNYSRRVSNHGFGEEQREPKVLPASVAATSTRSNNASSPSTSTQKIMMIAEDGEQIAKGGVACPFPWRLHQLLDDADEYPSLKSIVSWQSDGRCFKVLDSKAFESNVMPRYFNHTKWASFQRQLNMYGFTRFARSGENKGAYHHDCFVRGERTLVRNMVRRKIKGTGTTTTTKRRASNNKASAANLEPIQRVVSSETPPFSPNNASCCRSEVAMMTTTTRCVSPSCSCGSGGSSDGGPVLPSVMSSSLPLPLAKIMADLRARQGVLRREQQQQVALAARTTATNTSGTEESSTKTPVPSSISMGAGTPEVAAAASVGWGEIIVDDFSPLEAFDDDGEIMNKTLLNQDLIKDLLQQQDEEEVELVDDRHRGNNDDHMMLPFHYFLNE